MVNLVGNILLCCVEFTFIPDEKLSLWYKYTRTRNPSFFWAFLSSEAEACLLLKTGSTIGLIKNVYSFLPSIFFHTYSVISSDTWRFSVRPTNYRQKVHYLGQARCVLRCVGGSCRYSWVGLKIYINTRNKNSWLDFPWN